MSALLQADRIHELLPWFVAGTLDTAETEAFRNHLLDCAACREEMKVLKALKKLVETHGEDFFSDHPAADRLVAAVRGNRQGDLSDEEAATIRRHLVLCSTCATEARWASGESVAGDVPAATPFVKPVAAERPWVWALAAAAIVFALMLPWGLRDRPGPGSTGIPPVFFVVGTERSDAEESLYEVPADTPVISLMFEVDLGESSFPATIEIRTATGRTVTEATGIDQDFLAGGIYAVANCGRTDCPDGSYAAVIRPAPSSGEPAIEIPFRLETR